MKSRKIIKKKIVPVKICAGLVVPVDIGRACAEVFNVGSALGPAVASVARVLCLKRFELAVHVLRRWILSVVSFALHVSDHRRDWGEV